MTYVIGIHYDNKLYLFINITCDYIQTLLIHFIDSTLKIHLTKNYTSLNIIASLIDNK